MSRRSDNYRNLHEAPSNRTEESKRTERGSTADGRFGSLANLRRRLLALLSILSIAGAVSLGTTASESRAASTPNPPNPPSNLKVLSPGQLPAYCSAADFEAYPQFFGFNVPGYYWSEISNRWISAPYCLGRWGGLSMAPSQIVKAGQTVTVTLNTDDARLGPKLVEGSAISWGYPGTLVSGCAANTLTCTVKMGDAAKPPKEWSWGEFHVSAPHGLVSWPDSYGFCPASDPCLSSIGSHAWTFVGVGPGGGTPVASFTYESDPGSDPGTFRFTSTTKSVGGFTPSLEWDFGDGSGTQTAPFVIHKFAKAGIYVVKLKATIGGESDTASQNVETAPPALAVSVNLLDNGDGGRIAIVEKGKTSPKRTLRVTVAAVGGIGTVKGITFDGSVLSLSPLGLVELVSTPTPSPFDLDAGKSADFDVEVIGRQTGVLRVNSAVTGKVGTTTTTGSGSTRVKVAC
jgi:hypothetical protein